MRKSIVKQFPLMYKSVDHRHAKELDTIGKILDRKPEIYEIALGDLSAKVKNPGTGAQGCLNGHYFPQGLKALSP
jgi:hypothetical protein